VVSDEMLAFLGWDIPALTELERDPRYLIGRLTQALAALLAAEVPPPDATARLLGEAIEDAMRHRRTTCAKCPPEDLCAACRPNWLRADRYAALYGLLGIVGELPQPPADLTVVPR
jgi:hypothetical protein